MTIPSVAAGAYANVARLADPSAGLGKAAGVALFRLNSIAIHIRRSRAGFRPPPPKNGVASHGASPDFSSLTDWARIASSHFAA